MDHCRRDIDNSRNAVNYICAVCARSKLDINVTILHYYYTLEINVKYYTVEINVKYYTVEINVFSYLQAIEIRVG